jgi:hypothetical protein
MRTHRSDAMVTITGQRAHHPVACALARSDPPPSQSPSSLTISLLPPSCLLFCCMQSATTCPWGEFSTPP